MPTILYLHGFNSTGTVFNYLLAQLPKHKSVVADYDSRMAISDILAKLKNKIPSEKFYIVAHSLGGIVAHQIALSNPNVLGIVTISTPFGGHDIAGLIGWFYPAIKILRDLAPSSKVVRSCKHDKLKDIKWVNIITTGGSLPFMPSANDGVVPTKSQQSINADVTLTVNTNHFEIMQHPRLLKTITARLFAPT